MLAVPTPVPIIAMPMPDMIVRTSAKSRLIEARHEDQVGDALHGLLQHGVGDLERFEQRRAAIHHGEQPLVGNRDQRVHDVASASMPASAWSMRFLPSNVNGLVTTAP